MVAKHFQRRIENFICAHCGHETEGRGYTNHCPNCLFSKHVDVNPGDRQEICGGMMKPVDMETRKGQYFIVQQCEKCGHIRKNRFSENDNIEALIKLSKTVAKKLYF